MGKPMKVTKTAKEMGKPPMPGKGKRPAVVVMIGVSKPKGVKK